MTDWPIDRLRRARGLPGGACPLSPAGARKRSAGAPEAPGFALTERGARGLRIVAADRAAAALGIGPGMSLADARARGPGLRSAEIDRAADAAALVALGRWMTRWSPVVALDGRDGLALDITGCAHLSGGEAALMADVSARLAGAGIAHRLGLAASLGAAWALAHVAPGRITRIEGGAEALEAGLAPLPAAGLRLAPEALRLLHRFGLTRIGQVARLPRASLARRFRSAGGETAAGDAAALADQVLLRLDQALGRLVEPLAPLGLPPEHAERLPCPEPLLDLAGIEAGLGRLLGRLAERLAAAGQGARRFRLRAYRADGVTAAVEIRTARPVRDPAHVARLFGERLAAIDPGHGIDLLVLEAEGVAAMETAPAPLGRGFAGAAPDMAALAALADRLAARLGPEAVTVTWPRASHLPEHAERAAPFTGELPDWSAPGALPPPGSAPRPLRLLIRPEPVEVVAELPDGPPARFVWRRVARRVVRARGPERLGPEWWRLGLAPRDFEDRARDCYAVEDSEGRRYWLCREGLYDDGRGALPRWRILGLFT
ncbi:DNA polymerase Y family protein [Paralimibaculum aggregatum]|uniref:DNA-directed DNA polymerase n=2 Tax=Paralimibaculum aggregatum TaxID=3036245 RepID=A0ABQ6LQ69_9RHOB|nr:DNA polymerase Y family protein [Limibaculum sp. NKW23]